METKQNRRWPMLMARWDRAMRLGLLASVLLHVLVVLLFQRTPALPHVATAAAGEDANDDQAARGGGTEVVAIRMVTPPPAQPQVETPPIPVPVPEPRVIVQEEPPPPAPTPAPTPGTQASAGEGRGQETGPGTETGTGRGDAGSGESGLNRMMPPSPRGLILPPSDRPGKVRGKTITVYVFVTDRGMVQADSTRLAPGSGDSGFDNRLRRQAAEWVFHPAQRDGRAIAGWFEYTITL